jgi:hypothetical protein
MEGHTDDAGKKTCRKNSLFGSGPVAAPSSPRTIEEDTAVGILRLLADRMNLPFYV